MSLSHNILMFVLFFKSLIEWFKKKMKTSKFSENFLNFKWYLNTSTMITVYIIIQSFTDCSSGYKVIFQKSGQICQECEKL